MLERDELRLLGACLLKGQHPEYSPDLCLAIAEDLLRANERGVPFPDQHITRDLGPMPWDRIDVVGPFMRPKGAEVPA